MTMEKAENDASAHIGAFSLSLCVCSRDRVDTLRRCLDSVASADVLPQEVIVSDDSRDPAPTEALCRAYPFVRYVRGPQRGLCANRNQAVRASSGRYLSFLDDDGLMARDFVSVAAALVSQETARVVFTGDLLEAEQQWRLTPTNPNFWGHYGAAIKKEYLTIHINSNLLPRAVFRQISFDENLLYGYDEMDICAQALAAGYRIEYRPALANRHVPPLKDKAARAQEQSQAEGARFYTSVKRLWVLQRRPLRAIAYIVLAPLHRTAFDVKMKNWKDIPRAFGDMARALRLLRGWKMQGALSP